MDKLVRLILIVVVSLLLFTQGGCQKPLEDSSAAAVVEKAGPASGGNVQHRAAWMQEARWGVMTHYLADWRAKVDKEEMSVENWNNMIDHFDVEGLAEQIKSVGAGYYLITIGQNSGYYLAPNATYDKFAAILPSRCSKRDLVADLYEPLHKRGIKLMVYLPSGGLRWLEGDKSDSRRRGAQLRWEAVIQDWSTRWGDKVVGWWFDGCYFPNTMYRFPDTPNFASFAAAARAGNPNSVVAFNPGVVDRALSITPFEDYTAGEIELPERAMIRRAVNGIVDGAQVHFLSYLGERWGMGSPRFTTEQVVEWSRNIMKKGGVITWDVPIQKSGLISQPFIDQLAAVGKALDQR